MLTVRDQIAASAKQLVLESDSLKAAEGLGAVAAHYMDGDPSKINEGLEKILNAKRLVDEAVKTLASIDFADPIKPYEIGGA